MDRKGKEKGLEKDSNQPEHTSKATGFTLSPSGYKDSWFMPDDVIMDQLVDEDNEIMGKATDEDVLTIPNGPMTSSRTKKLNEASGGISIDTPFASSIDYSIMISIDALVKLLCGLIECLLRSLDQLSPYS
uniref:Uncharacterized protein n=1 Tax=Brassica campestris TaxID=3711 RepID=M4EWF3_BRACM